MDALVSRDEAEQWLLNPPDGRFLTAKHIFLPHTYLPPSQQEPVFTAISYVKTGVVWGGGGWLLGHLLDKDARLWARNGLIIGFGARFVLSALLLRGLDWASAEAQRADDYIIEPPAPEMGRFV